MKQPEKSISIYQHFPSSKQCLIWRPHHRWGLTRLYALYSVDCTPVTHQACGTATSNLKFIGCAVLGIVNCIAAIESFLVLCRKEKNKLKHEFKSQKVLSINNLVFHVIFMRFFRTFIYSSIRTVPSLSTYSLHSPDYVERKKREIGWDKIQIKKTSSQTWFVSARYLTSQSPTESCSWPQTEFQWISIASGWLDVILGEGGLTRNRSRS